MTEERPLHVVSQPDVTPGVSGRMGGLGRLVLVEMRRNTEAQRLAGMARKPSPRRVSDLFINRQ